MKTTRKSILMLIIVSVCCAGLFACKTSKGTPTAAKFSTNDNYRLIISFISIGTGIDANAHEAIKKFIDEHPKKPLAETYHWGREGEIDYCLQLKELSSKEQKAFVEEVKKLAGKSDRVQFSENAPCVHKK